MFTWIQHLKLFFQLHVCECWNFRVLSPIWFDIQISSYPFLLWWHHFLPTVYHSVLFLSRSACSDYYFHSIGPLLLVPISHLDAPFPSQETWFWPNTLIAPMHFSLRNLLSFDCIWIPFAIASTDDSSLHWICCRDAFSAKAQGIVRTSFASLQDLLLLNLVSFRGISIFLPIVLFLYQEELVTQVARFVSYHDHA